MPKEVFLHNLLRARLLFAQISKMKGALWWYFPCNNEEEKEETEEAEKEEEEKGEEEEEAEKEGRGCAVLEEGGREEVTSAGSRL